MDILSGPTKVEARKPHRCDWCGRAIDKEERYYRATCVSGGEMYTWKSHEQCMGLVMALEIDGDEGITENDFKECVSDKYFELKDEGDKVLPFEERIEFVYNRVVN